MKLTLSLDKETIEFAHKLARESNDSISNMVGTFFKHARKRREKDKPLHPALKRLQDFTKSMSFPEDKRAMMDVLLKKHLR